MTKTRKEHLLVCNIVWHQVPKGARIVDTLHGANSRYLVEFKYSDDPDEDMYILVFSNGEERWFYPNDDDTLCVVLEDNRDKLRELERAPLTWEELDEITGGPQ
jgi:hypothetical protein